MGISEAGARHFEEFPIVHFISFFTLTFLIF